MLLSLSLSLSHTLSHISLTLHITAKITDLIYVLFNVPLAITWVNGFPNRSTHCGEEQHRQVFCLTLCSGPSKVLKSVLQGDSQHPCYGKVSLQLPHRERIGMLTSTLGAYHPPMLPGLSDAECHLFLINRAAENVVYLWVSLLENTVACLWNDVPVWPRGVLLY